LHTLATRDSDNAVIMYPGLVDTFHRESRKAVQRVEVDH